MLVETVCGVNQVSEFLHPARIPRILQHPIECHCDASEGTATAVLCTFTMGGY